MTLTSFKQTMRFMDNMGNNRKLTPIMNKQISGHLQGTFSHTQPVMVMDLRVWLKRHVKSQALNTVR